ncbi:acetyltransferase [Limosilactobacillus sp. STM2_1]|uniref:Acetyltransferase n=1 Tax=Limosilactobacillus rudii TaxID=2759755 RepID=A0A7W3UMK2_9LACO|nr:acyltransferase family protein [Limosilactobacillus rudii]MBB1080312.1 acetyltransferase [Limosilactobacillus rudii]MBB1098338.1 acetyltransferase [Limosilactobacillus rudii]MCD7135346.1 acetyltransferase [Limosilactobacillus rudii]
MKPNFNPSQGTHTHYFVTGIDGLRTLAVFGVIIYHLLPNFLMGGYLGVPLFLLISGYFVTYQFNRQLKYGGRIDIGCFYLKRFRRLYPTLIAMLVLTTAYITLFARELLHNIRAIIITNLTWIYNWWEISHGQSYFDQFGGISPFTHLWTLGVEAQFYLLWPLIITLLFRVFKETRIVRRAVFALAILSAIEMAVLYDPSNINRVYYGTDTRAFSLFLGSWLGLAWPLNRLRPKLQQNSRNLLNIVGILAMAITIIGFCTLNGQSAFTYRGGMFFYSFVGLLLMATILHPGASMNKWLSNPVFHWIGQRSYGIYVYQYPVMIFYERIIKVGNYPLVNALVEIGIILAISEVSYRLVERPCAKYQWSNLLVDFQRMLERHRISWQSGSKLIAGTLVFIIAFIGFCQPNRAPKKTAVQQRIEQNHQAAEKHNKKIAKGETIAEASGNTKKLQKQYDLTPTQIKAAQKLKVTAIGDSVMADAADSIQKLMPNAYVDAQVGRQGSATPAVIRQLKADGHLNKIVILNLGTNGSMTQDTLDEILSAIGPGHQIYWLTAHVPTKPWQKTVNSEIKDVAKKHKNVHVVDWYKASQGHAEWFASDNVHMGPAGNDHFARLIAKAVLADR